MIKTQLKYLSCSKIINAIYPAVKHNNSLFPLLGTEMGPVHTPTCKYELRYGQLLIINENNEK